MRTRNKSTRFMNGNIDIDTVIFDMLVDKYGMGVVCCSDFDFDECVYSDGFINAVESGMSPVLDSIRPTEERKWEQEYHHFIFNDECYVMYFE